MIEHLNGGSEMSEGKNISVSLDAEHRRIAIHLTPNMSIEQAQLLESEYSKALRQLGAGKYCELVTLEGKACPGVLDKVMSILKRVIAATQGQCVAVARVMSATADLQLGRLSGEAQAAYITKRFVSSTEAISWLNGQMAAHLTSQDSNSAA